LNGDAYQDVAVALERTGAATDQNVQILWGNGDGTFTADVNLTTAADTVTSVVVADLDADGKPDMAVPNESGGIGIMFLCNEEGICFDTSPFANPPESGFQQQLPSGVSSGGSVAVQAGKLNGDAYPDVTVLSADGGVIDVLINTTGGARPLSRHVPNPALRRKPSYATHGASSKPGPLRFESGIRALPIPVIDACTHVPAILLLLKLLIRAVIALALPRRALVFENLALRHQLGALAHGERRPRLGPADRLFWIALRSVWRDWPKTLAIMKPTTVVGRHRRGIQAYWRPALRATCVCTGTRSSPARSPCCSGTWTCTLSVPASRARGRMGSRSAGAGVAGGNSAAT
jgi:hypothetical protein